MVNVLSHEGMFMSGFQAKELPVPTGSVPQDGPAAAGAGDRTGGCTGLGPAQGRSELGVSGSPRPELR